MQFDEGMQFDRMQFDRGYLSPYFVTDNGSMTSQLDEPYILMYDGKISAVKELLPILERVSQQNKSLLIVAEDIDGEALAAMIVNKMRGIPKCAAVKAPDFGERRTMILEDMAALTGGTVISKQKGMKLDKVTFDMLGEARGVTISKEETTIVDGSGTEEAIETRLHEIKDQIEKAESNYAREQLQQRLGKLAGGVAVINVGGYTEAEMNERKDRVDDAVHAVKAAIEEGILPGGGHALLCASTNVENDTLNSSQEMGYEIVRKSIRKPFYQILSNAGYNHEKCTLAALNVEGNFELGWNLATENEVNMLSEGIIDPTKVTRCALENAASAAGILLTTECVITDTLSFSFLGVSVITHSVVRRIPAAEAAFSRAQRVTLVGSIIPSESILTSFSVAKFHPNSKLPSTFNAANVHFSWL
jgi:chaperonin GroEL